MAKVNELMPGDTIKTGPINPAEFAIFLGRISPHPMSRYNDGFKGLDLVIWRMNDGRVSFDALMPIQDVGHISESATVRTLQDALGIRWG